MKPKKLYKTTIIIWSEYDGNQVELEDLVREATSGDALCTQQESVQVNFVGDHNEDDDAADAADAIASFFDYDLDDDDDDDADDADNRPFGQAGDPGPPSL